MDTSGEGSTRGEDVVYNVNGNRFRSSLRQHNATFAHHHSQDSHLFKRELRTMVVEEGTDLHFLQEGFITVTPIGALSQVDVDCQNYYKEWLPKITNQP
ncbi:unnamed protein product [Brassica oleracea]|uniref:Uncharacterized protein n=1 Tax=Brassica oleracea var. oleracea TaxID=109376 RepID=A0A0D3A832_BRAOL